MSRELDWMRQISCLASTLYEPQSLGFLLRQPEIVCVETLVVTREDFMSWIIVTKANFARTLDSFEHFRLSFVHRCRLCYDLRYPNFDHFICRAHAAY
ncbi:hypothetical protein TNCV_653681 [Trichonephila clavipes]|nr:hypothetical protein TNCV_653681 [Trichonephila clavipes]